MWCVRCPKSHIASLSGPSSSRTVASSAPLYARPPARPLAPVQLYSKHRPPSQAQDEASLPEDVDEDFNIGKDPISHNVPSRRATPNTPNGRTTRPRPPAPAPTRIPEPATTLKPHRHPRPSSGEVTAGPTRTAAPAHRQADKVGWASVALVDILPALHRGKITTARSAHFHIRAAPAQSLPRPRPPPFPVDRLRKRPQRKVINFAFLATKAKVSKLATKRNQARRRLKAAVDMLVNGRGGADGDPRLVVEGVVYVAQVEKSVLDVPFPRLCEDVERALLDIKKKEGAAAVAARFSLGPAKKRTPW